MHTFIFFFKLQSFRLYRGSLYLRDRHVFTFLLFDIYVFHCKNEEYYPKASLVPIIGFDGRNTLFLICTLTISMQAFIDLTNYLGSLPCL